MPPGSPLARMPRPSLACAVVGAFLFVACCFPMTDTDFWWHLKTGELILQRGQLPDLDWYTFTDADKPWIDLHWGFQVFITGIWRLGGANLMVLVKAAAYTLAVLIAMQAAGRDLPTPHRVFFWLLPAIAVAGRAYERPEMLSLIFLATWFLILDRAERDPRRLWWLVPLQLVWTNCHALFVLGLVTGACFAADWIVRGLAGQMRLSSRLRLAPLPAGAGNPVLLIVATLVAATAFLNPWLDEGAFFPLVLYRKFSVEQAYYSVNIGEFQIPYEYYRKYGFSSPFLNVEIWLWGLTALSFVFAAARGRWSLFRVLMFVGFSRLAWAASRNISIFGIVAGVILCANARELIAPGDPEQRIGDRETLLAGLRRLAQWPGFSARGVWDLVSRWMAVLVPGTLMALIVTGLWSDSTDPKTGQLRRGISGEYKPFRLGEREAWFGHDAMKFAGREGFPDHAYIYHNGLAGTYIYHNSPPKKVFMDARLEVSTRATFEHYNRFHQQILMGDLSWTPRLQDAKHRLPVIILDSRNSRLHIAVMSQIRSWRLVFADGSAAVFLDARLADQLKLPAASLEPLKVPPN